MAWWFGPAAEMAAKIGAKLTEWIPSKRESLRNRIDQTKRAMDEMLKKNNEWTARDSAHYADLAVRLRKLQAEAENN